MKKLSYYFYSYNNGLIYDKTTKISMSDDCYKILKKYKIPDFLKSVMIVRQKLNEADRGLVFIGYDKNDKLQYFYGDLYVAERKKKKLKAFLMIDEKKKIINKYISDNKLSDFNNVNYDSILALLLLLEFKFYIRTGRKKYKDENDTTGILTLKKSDIKINDEDIFITFKGKKGVCQRFVVSKILDEYIYNFLYYLYYNADDDDFIFSINGNFVGESRFYRVLKTLGIKLKDIRTYGSNCILIRELWKFLNTSEQINKRDIKSMIKSLLNKTAETIGHTKSISKKSYVIEALLKDDCLNDIIKNFNNNYTKFYNYIVNKLKNE